MDDCGYRLECLREAVRVVTSARGAADSVVPLACYFSEYVLGPSAAKVPRTALPG